MISKDLQLYIQNHPTYSLIINGEMHHFSTEKLITYIFANEKNISPEEGYGLASLLERLKIFHVFSGPSELYCNDLLNYKIVDYEYLKENITFMNPILSEVKPDFKLIDCLVEKIPKDIHDPLEIAVRCYFAVCHFFEYDFDYVTSVVTYHNSPLYIKSINLDNNKIVCFEFAIILCYLLKKFSIPCTLNSNSLQDYGLEHLFVKCLISSFILKFDSTINFFFMDFYIFKMQKKPMGIKVLNQSETSKSLCSKQLNTIINRIYHRDETYYRTLNRLKNEINFSNISFEELKDTFVFFVHQNALHSIEFFDYVSDLVLDIFQENYFIYISIIRANTNKNASLLIKLKGKLQSEEFFLQINTNHQVDFLDKKMYENIMHNENLVFKIENDKNTIRR